MVGHITYDLIYENQEVYSVSETFLSFEELIHFISFRHLFNMQEKYGVVEVRIANVYITDLSEEETERVVKKANYVLEGR